jgi:hypothetical protein
MKTHLVCLGVSLLVASSLSAASKKTQVELKNARGESVGTDYEASHAVFLRSSELRES